MQRKKAQASYAEKKIIGDYCSHIHDHYDVIKGAHGVGCKKGEEYNKQISLNAGDRQADIVAGDIENGEVIVKEIVEVEMCNGTFDRDQVRELHDHCKSNQVEFTLIIPEEQYDEYKKDIYSCLCMRRRGEAVFINYLTYSTTTFKEMLDFKLYCS
ncbi:MAG: hypothetical protein GF399_11405 [Candidatus Coatesbacteria bacterium]|nr:hypothetical protein [Candidatus Coatesbacteria bacterium]